MLGNGNKIGAVTDVSTAAARGVWSLSEQINTKRDLNWPYPLGVNYLNSYSVNAQSATATFSSVAFGGPAIFRHIIVTITGSRGADNRIPTSVTIGGVAATLHIVQQDNSGVRENYSAIASAIVPTDTNGTVIVVHNDVISSCVISVFTVYRTNNSITPVQTNGKNAAPLQNTTTLSSHAYLLAVCNSDVVIANNATWTNALEASDFVTTFGGASDQLHSSAYSIANISSVSVALQDESGVESLAITTWNY
jgi:hypothetical protein